MRRFTNYTLGLATLFALAACARPETLVDPRIRPTGMVASFSDADWQAVLSAVATPNGYVRWERLAIDDPQSQVHYASTLSAAHPMRILPYLRRYLALLAVVSPDNRPDLFQVSGDRTAYWINAYNAACMYGVLLHHAAAPTDTLYTDERFEFGERLLTLSEIEHERLHVSDDPRIVFALNRCTRSSPPLRSEPYLPNKVNFMLNDQAMKCLADPRFVVLDGTTARLNERLLVAHQQDFASAAEKKTGKAVSFLDALKILADGHGGLPNATAWRPMPYDGKLNIPPSEAKR